MKVKVENCSHEFLMSLRAAVILGWSEGVDYANESETARKHPSNWTQAEWTETFKEVLE